MMSNVWVDILARWGHGLFGITWIGMLYYFNFVQGEYFKEASKEALPDVKAKLATRALWWFRWGAMMTFITGVVLLGGLAAAVNAWILLGALMGTFMFLNVWLIIWPNQKVVLGLKSGDVASSAGKAGLASRTNVLFSAPMLFCMFASKHGAAVSTGMIPLKTSGLTTGLIAALALTVILELNALFGKMGPMASVKGVIHLSLALTAALVAMVVYL
ncbi:urate hydroxylase PuuD [Marinicella marina]|uniref:urate hydroxylase PuuD n=2 Tax=Marinicella marina TaxID=2996016 RepID=UPI002260B115|nr:urate hydroxylase PuuD [Marinicella marina]MDJ1140468.1 urate hydroxylase PuuD [Marinicella marina]